MSGFINPGYVWLAWPKGKISERKPKKKNPKKEVTVPRTRTFDGEKYKLKYCTGIKYLALRSANISRDKGRSARVVPFKDDNKTYYAIYENFTPKRTPSRAMKRGIKK